MKKTERFVSLVREYVTLIEGTDAIRPHELLSKCSVLLTELYLLGSQLPEVDPQNEEVSSKQSPRVYLVRLIKFLGKYDVYHMVFDPIFDKEAAWASLANDLDEIYLDLKKSLQEYDQGSQTEALWQWRFDMRYHAGMHIVAALQPIHFLIYLHMSPDYVSDKTNPQPRVERNGSTMGSAARFFNRNVLARVIRVINAIRTRIR